MNAATTLKLYAQASRNRASRPGSSHRNWLAVTLPALVASVWLYHGLYNKLLGGEPRHRAIIQSVPALSHDAVGLFVLDLVGVAEVMLAGWVIWGRYPRTCATVQTLALLAMNAVELTFARQHLLWPAALLPINFLFLTVAWAAAETRRRANSPGNALYPLRRHPIPVRAHFRHSLVLTYAFPREVLEALLPPGLTLDAYNGYGLVAVAMVETQDLRPTFLPWAFGQDFVLTGYRIFAKFKHDGCTRRGLRIIRSDANRWSMIAGGNALTHYNFRKCDAEVHEHDGALSVMVRTPGAAADVRVTADLRREGALPDGSPFASLRDARRFAGPLPLTFDYEPQTHSIITIRGVRENWQPRLVNVNVKCVTFFDRPEFRGLKPVLASAFYVQDIPYRWERGVRYPLAEESPT